MLTLLGGDGESYNVPNYKWDAGLPKAEDWWNGRMGGDLKLTLFEVDVDVVKKAFHGEGWVSTDDPSCPHGVGITIVEPLNGLIVFECVRWDTWDDEGDTVKITGSYIEAYTKEKRNDK